jgi:hypothetical protein
MPFSITMYATIKLTSRGLRTSHQPMERVWRVSHRAGMRWVRPSPGTVFEIGNEKLCLGRRVSDWFCAALRRSVSRGKRRPWVTLAAEKVMSWGIGQICSGSKWRGEMCIWCHSGLSSLVWFEALWVWVWISQSSSFPSSALVEHAWRQARDTA